MARLRIRLKLNEGRRGAPLSKLGKIAEQAEKFLRALAGDCEIETKSGEWLAVDFDNGSVSYDAEFQGDVNPAVANIFARNIESLADYDPDLRGIIPMLGSNTMQSQCFVSVLGNSVTVEIESSKIKLR